MASSNATNELRQFAEGTTFHGIGNIVTEKRHVCIRLSWMLAFLIVLGIYLYFLCTSLISYFNYPVVTNVEYLTTDKLDFPSVTICNSNLVRFSVVAKDEELKYVFRAPGWDKDYPINESNVDVEMISTVVAHQPSDMYLECEFDGQHQTPCNVSQKVSWDRSPDGYCHTFNSKEKIDLKGEKITTTRPGEDYGLFLLINIEQYEYLMTLRNASGIQVVIHDQNTLPDMKQKGFLVSPGTETLVELKKTNVKRLPEPYAKSPNLCEDTAKPGYENPLKYFSHYSLSACRRECRIQHQLDSCNCSAHYYGGSNVKICSYKDFGQCSFPARSVFDSNPSLLADCNCLPPCEETVYDVSISSATMPHDLVEALSMPKITSDNIQKNIIILKIFFGEMRYTLTEQQAQYSATSLFGELGGQMGLCLGASVLTICELLQLLGTLCAEYFKRNSQTTKIVDVKVMN